MPDSFDPYHKWLGISPKDQPPNHYRLLGVDPFESDPGVIESAADRQMSHVRTFQSGKHSVLSQQLLNEIAAAKIILLNSEKRARYDKELKAQLFPPETVDEGPKPSDFASLKAPASVVPPPAPSAGELKPAWQRPWVWGSVAVGLVVLLLAGILVFGPGGHPPVAEQDAAEPPTETEESEDASDVDDPGPADDEEPVAETDDLPLDAQMPLPEMFGPSERPKKPRMPREKRVKPPPNPLPPEGKLDGPVDLLALIDLGRDAIKGQWQFDDKELICPPRRRALLQLPVVPPEEYVLTLVATRQSGRQPLDIGLVVGGVQTILMIDGWFGTVTGLHHLDGKRAVNNESTHKGAVFVDGEPNTIVCTVRKMGVHVTSNGQTILNWAGDPQRLSLDRTWKIRDPRQLFLAKDWIVSYSISKLELAPLGPDAPVPTPPPAVVTPLPKAQPEPPAKTPVAEKLPVPDAADREKAGKELREIFQKQYADASRSEGKAELAKTLLENALETTDNPTARYVMLAEAANLAAESGQTALARRAVTLLPDLYEIAPWKLRSETLAQLGHSARLPEARQAVTTWALELVEQALAANEYEVADKVANTAMAVASRGRDVALRKRVTSLRNRVRVVQKTWDEFRPAFETIENRPDDPEANLAAGKFLCFIKGSWDEGLPHLSKGSDPALKAVAEAELSRPVEPAAQVELADKWWDLADAMPSSEKELVRSRAGSWYQKAEPRLTGLERARVEKRLHESGRLVDLFDLIQPKNVVYVGKWQFDGKALVSPPDPSARIQLPYEPPEEYRLTIDIQRLSTAPIGREMGRNAFVLGLSSGPVQFVAAVDFQPHGLVFLNCLMLLDGQDVRKNKSVKITNFGNKPAIPQGQVSELLCTVRKDQVTVTLDGKTMIDWSGDFKRLSMPPDWAVPHPKRLFLGSRLCSFRITKLEVMPLDDQ